MIEEKIQIKQSQIQDQNSKEAKNEPELGEFEQLREILPINIFLSQMKEPDLKKRQQYVLGLPSIAIALGPEKCRAILIPFIQTLQEDDMDIEQEILQVIPQLVNCIGGPAYAHLLLELLFNYTQKSNVVDDTQVQTIDSLKKIISCIDIKKNEKLLMHAMDIDSYENQDLNAKEPSRDQVWQKEITLTMIGEIYIGVSEESQRMLLNIFFQICKSTKEKYRVIGSKYLKEMIKLIPITPEQDLIEIFEIFLKDTSEGVRCYLLEALLPLIQLGDNEQKQMFLDFLKTLLNDNSWKVKSGFITNISQLVESLDKETLEKTVITSIQGFLDGNDSETKNKFLSKQVDFLKALGVENFNDLFLPYLEKLISDKNIFVKANTGDAILSLAMETQKLKDLEKVFNIFLETSDKENSFKFIQKVKNFKDLQFAMSPNIFKPLVKAISIIMQNKKWRIRMNSLQALTKISNELEISLDLIDDIFFGILETGLKDKTYLVRIECIQVLENLSKQIGPQVFKKHIIDKIFQAIQDDTNYMVRINMPLIIKKIIQQQHKVSDEMIILLQKFSNDKVPNIKIVLIEIFNEIGIQQIKNNKTMIQIVQKLCGDNDLDVKQQAQKMLSNL